MPNIMKLTLNSSFYSGNHIGDRGAFCLSRMQGIKNLNLSSRVLASNKIGDAGDSHLSRMQEIRNGDFQGTTSEAKKTKDAGNYLWTITRTQTPLELKFLRASKRPP